MTADIMRELRDAPAGWFIYADNGHDLEEHAAYPIPTEKAEYFRIIVQTPQGITGILMFTRRPDGWQMDSAISLHGELTTLLHEMTDARSLTWWKRYALVSITLARNKMDEDALARLSPKAVELFQSIGRERLMTAQTIPLRKQRRRWTDDDLKQIADWWLEAHNAGSRTPTRDVADRLNAGKTGNAALSLGRVRHLVSEARRKYFQGVVPEGSPPRADKPDPRT